jgi:hypothetical protein
MLSVRQTVRVRCPNCSTEVVRVWWTDRFRWKLADRRSRLTMVRFDGRAGTTVEAEVAFWRTFADPSTQMTAAVADAAAVTTAWGASLLCPVCPWSGSYNTERLVRWFEAQRDAGVVSVRLPDPRAEFATEEVA